jgi:type 1 glutamine amidotransferase
MRKALIVHGGWPGHQPRECADVVAAMLREDGFDVTLAENTAALATLNLPQMSLIVPIVTMSTIAKEEVDALCAAVEAGTGLAGFHGQMGDSFRNEVKYQFMVGGQWVAHPGNIIDYTVNITRPDDPVMQGLGDFPYRSEQYYMHVDPNNEVLATTTFSGAHCAWIDGHTIPVVWKRYHGIGRVFYSALGHVAAEFEVPSMAAILRRGMNWAARG